MCQLTFSEERLRALQRCTGIAHRLKKPSSVLAQASTTRPEIYTSRGKQLMFQLEFPSGAGASCPKPVLVSIMNHLQVNYEKRFRWPKWKPHSSLCQRKITGATVMSDGNIIDFPSQPGSQTNG